MQGLLLADNNGPIWKVNNQIITGLPVGTFHFPELPDNLYSRPTLVWTLDNSGAAAQRVEASYLTGNMNWSSDYVLTVGRDEKTADLDGWVTLVNNSGAAYTNAKLQLVAGQVHRTAQRPGGAMRDEVMAMNKVGCSCGASASPRNHFRNITCTRSIAAPRSRITNRSRSACFPERESQLKNICRSKVSNTTIGALKASATPCRSR